MRLALGVLVVLAGAAAADSTSGVDGALFRSSYDANGIFALEGARLMPKRDLSLKVLGGYGQSPVDLAVPGIGDVGDDSVLKYVATLDLTFGMTLTDRIAIGISAAAYRAKTADGYGQRGRYQSGGNIARPSTGLIALRPLSNIDPSAPPGDASSYLGDELAGPLDARGGIKLAVVRGRQVSVAVIASVFLPFGEDEMLLGDRNLVFEPKLALEWRKDRIAQTRFLANIAARIRERTVLESYDSAMQTDADAAVVLDVGSEIVAGAGGVLELTPRIAAAAEAQVFVPLPGQTWGRCRRYNGDPCASIGDADYFGDAGKGDLTVLATAGALFRINADVTAMVMAGTGQLGVRGDDFRVTTGLVWAPQPAGVAAPGRGDKDGDRVPDSVDGCADEAEDKDGYQDEDGCPDRDNDGDGLADDKDRCSNDAEDRDGFEDDDGCPEADNDTDGVSDVADRCPNDVEDRDGFEDDDGCPDDDNDNDGFVDAKDRCPNDQETVNGVDDEDGCPDVRGTSGPEERADRIDLKGQPISFTRGTATLTAAAKRLLDQTASIIKARKLAIRVEVHVALGTASKNAGQIAAQKRRDKTLANQRARAILDYLFTQGVTVQQLQAVGIGSDRPLGTA
ncbi:MAG TPA: OmpA family protein, partial [Kofleriaceae bacterium]|nr:OmpA family protein [Kofleriaceae bacterium]